MFPFRIPTVCGATKEVGMKFAQSFGSRGV